MLKRYKDLNLKTVREKADLDFAHYTFKPRMCSCCYGPSDLPSIYWKNREIKKSNYQYILFKNADNGSGHVTKNDLIEGTVYIMWGFPMEKMPIVCEELQKQLGDDYDVVAPESDMKCIAIRSKVQKIEKPRYPFRR